MIDEHSRHLRHTLKHRPIKMWFNLFAACVCVVWISVSAFQIRPLPIQQDANPALSGNPLLEMVKNNPVVSTLFGNGPPNGPPKQGGLFNDPASALQGIMDKVGSLFKPGTSDGEKVKRPAPAQSAGPEAPPSRTENTNNGNAAPDNNANGVRRPGNALANTISDKSAEIKANLQAFKDMSTEERQTLHAEQANVRKAAMQEIRQQIMEKKAGKNPN